MNPLLTKITQDIEAKVAPENLQAYHKAVTAGLTIMFNPKTHQHLELVKNPESRKDPVRTLANGITGLVWLMFQQSKQSMKAEVLVMAAVTLFCHAADFAEQSYGIQLTNEQIAQATRILAENLMKKLGITPAQLQDAINKGGAHIKAQQSLQGQPQQPQPGE